MVFLRILLNLLILEKVLSSNICPPQEVLAPCICNETYSLISCQDIRGQWDLKKIFDNASSYFQPGASFDVLRIKGTNTVKIESESIKNITFQSIYIDANLNLEFISPDAFPLTKNATVQVYILNNDRLNLSDILKFVSNFPLINYLVIRKYSGLILPGGAFASNPKLQSIHINYGELKKFESSTFAGLKKLYTLNLSDNKLSSDGIPPFAFEGFENLVDLLLAGNNLSYNGLTKETFHGLPRGQVELNLAANPIHNLEESIFKPLIENARKITVGGNPFQYLPCDKSIEWICENNIEYQYKLFGYRCNNPVRSVWDYCNE